MELHIPFSMYRTRKTPKKQNDRQHTKQNKRHKDIKMKIQTYRIIEYDGEIKPGVDIPQVFEFKIFGSKGVAKKPYNIEIHINEFTGKVVYTNCDCIDCSIRRNENCKRFDGKGYKCKHIKQGEMELIEDKHLTPCIKSANNIQQGNKTKRAAMEDESLGGSRLATASDKAPVDSHSVQEASK